MDTWTIVKRTFLFAALSCPGLSDAEDMGLEITIERQSYEREEAVVVHFRNSEARTVRYVAYVEALDGSGDWTSWPFRLEDGKPDVLPYPRSLDAGQEIDVQFQLSKAELPTDLPRNELAGKPDTVDFRICVRELEDEMTLKPQEHCSLRFSIRQPYD